MTYQIKLLIIWVFLAVSVFSMSYFYPNGRMSSDSYSYLKLAQNILDGHGMFLKDAYESSGVRYYAQWPPGYGFLIAITSLVTGIGVFWAAKTVNVIMLGLIMVFLGWIYKKKAPTIALIFLLGSPLNVVSMTWSESVMILGLLLFSEFLYRLHTTSRWRWVLAAIVAYGWIFFTRYVGVFTLLVVGCIALIALVKKRYKLVLQSVVVGVVGVIVSGLYLFNNIMRTGYVLGRAPASNDVGVNGLMKLLVHTLLGEMNLFFDLRTGFWMTLISIFFLLLLVVGIHQFSRGIDKGKTIGSSDVNRAVIITAVGVSQILAATYLLVFPGVIDNRYLLPVLVLGLIGLTDYLRRKPKIFKEWGYVLVVVAMISWTLNVPGKIFNVSVMNNSIKYPKAVEEIMSKYKDIAEGSLVAFGDKHLEYLRTDLYTGYLAPEVLKMSDKEFNENSEKMNLFIDKSCRTGIEMFYIEVNKEDRGLKYWRDRDVSVNEFFEGKNDGQLNVHECN